MASAHENLRAFLEQRMRMSHIYQPLMLKTLLQRRGRATVREIATAFLAEDQSQLEYYEAIVRRMPGPVLRRHDVVERDGDAFQLTPEFGDVSPEEVPISCDSAMLRSQSTRRSADGRSGSTARSAWARYRGRTGMRP